jgi:hypothetical protein
MMRCIFCGCTDSAACVISIDELEPAIRAGFLDQVARERRFLSGSSDFDFAPRISADGRTPCWWISREPPVCSAPACTAKLRASTAAAIEART